MYLKAVAAQCMLLSSYTKYDLLLQPPELTQIVEYSNYVFIGIFTLEMILKLVGEGPLQYIKDAFNVFDGFIVIMR